MIGEFSRAEELVLRCCANPDINRSKQFAELSKVETDELTRLALQTRTAALLHRASKGCESELTRRLSILARQYSLHNLKAGQALYDVVELLSSKDLQPIALKGVSLAFGSYPDLQLRPLRDLDLLLKPEQALAAQELLLAHGNFAFAQKAGRYGLEHSHQLPEIVHSPTGIVIEIHHRLNSKNWPNEPIFLEGMFSELTAINVLGAKVRVPSVSVNLLHLLEHATIHHVFGNGPLILADMHFLMRQDGGRIESVRRQAMDLGLEKALALCSAVGRELEADWPQSSKENGLNVAPGLVTAAMSAMLMNEEQVAQHNQRRRLGGSGRHVFRAAKRAMLPDLQELSKLSGQHSGRLSRWLGYPAWLFEKGGRYLRGTFNFGARRSFRCRDQLIDWIDG